MTGTLLKINGVWVTDPDPDSWSPVNCYEWTAGSGRVNTTGLFVGARKFCKYKLPCKLDNASCRRFGRDTIPLSRTDPTLQNWSFGTMASIILYLPTQATMYRRGLSDLTVVSITRAVLSHSQNVRRAYVHHSKQ